MRRSEELEGEDRIRAKIADAISARARAKPVLTLGRAEPALGRAEPPLMRRARSAADRAADRCRSAAPPAATPAPLPQADEDDALDALDADEADWGQPSRRRPPSR